MKIYIFVQNVGKNTIKGDGIMITERDLQNEYKKLKRKLELEGEDDE